MQAFPLPSPNPVIAAFVVASAVVADASSVAFLVSVASVFVVAFLVAVVFGLFLFLFLLLQQFLFIVFFFLLFILMLWLLLFFLLWSLTGLLWDILLERKACCLPSPPHHLLPNTDAIGVLARLFHHFRCCGEVVASCVYWDSL